jgi:hypothetical protein
MMNWRPGLVFAVVFVVVFAVALRARSKRGSGDR